jgi:hypothetical protein
VIVNNSKRGFVSQGCGGAEEVTSGLDLDSEKEVTLSRKLRKLFPRAPSIGT